jgi:serine/threonine protein kinase
MINSKIQYSLFASTIPIFGYLYNENINLKKVIEKKSFITNQTIYNKTLKNDVSSNTILSVSKKVTKNWDNNTINVYENEKKWLNQLKETNIIATPIHFDDINRIITTEYVGEKINKYNLPVDWEKQRDEIISILEKHNCRHNDIKPDEIIVYDGKIKLIDFGWANELNKPNPNNWPEGLGCKFRCNKGNSKFNDKCSFDKSIYFILNKK